MTELWLAGLLPCTSPHQVLGALVSSRNTHRRPRERALLHYLQKLGSFPGVGYEGLRSPPPLGGTTSGVLRVEGLTGTTPDEPHALKELSLKHPSGPLPSRFSLAVSRFPLHEPPARQGGDPEHHASGTPTSPKSPTPSSLTEHTLWAYQRWL